MSTLATTHQVRHWGFFAGGEFRTSGKPLQIRSPYDDSLVGTVSRPSDAEVESAVRSAQAAFAQVCALPAHQRAQILHGMAAGISVRRDEFVRVMALEAGKPVKAARVEVDRAIFNFRNAAEETVRIHHEMLALASPPDRDAGAWCGAFPLDRYWPSVRSISP
jgi:acyl-CoA reductase-like NAD-dependent aldehyde dehydrogenase